ncbi:MAG: gliding motility-associated C-terminal domain-containing protein, partial [Bacteroidota bacterium]
NGFKLFNAFRIDDVGGTEIYGLHITEFVTPIDGGIIGNIIIGSEEKGNIITRYDSIGLRLNFLQAFDQSRIQGNLIGIDEEGIVDGGGTIGILLSQASFSANEPLLIGGTQEDGGNVIAGNINTQVYIVSEADNIRISGNKLGTDLDGLNLPVGLDQDTAQIIGILIQTVSTDLFIDDITIGGDGLGEGNIIAYNRFGIGLLGANIRRNAILRNRIHCGTQTGIILLQGANQNKEAPIILSATNQLIQGVANSLDIVEVFLNTPEDCFNNQSSQGKIFLGRARADQQGVWSLPGNFLINRDAGDCVTATATDPDGNTSGYSECLPIEFEEPTRDSLDVPNAFSPNDDGSNDRWRIKNLTTLFPNNELQVFNRWGNQVYTARPFPINGWDGRTEQGNPLDIGTYFFILRLNDQERQEEVVKGSVTIIK